MMPPLELKRLKLELVKVAAAKEELLFRVEERLDEIERIKGHVKVQEDREAELKAKITEAERAS